MVLASFIVSRRSAAQIARPIATLSQATQQLAAGELTDDIPTTTQDEVAELTHAFNTMRARLEKRTEDLRCSIADLQHTTEELQRSNRALDEFAYVASHDLRSPLRGIAKLAAWISKDDENQFSDSRDGE